MVDMEYNKEKRHNYYLANKERSKLQSREWMNKHREEHKEWRKLWSRKYRLNKKIEVLKHYGGKCICCGESEIDFLTIDHPDGGGNKHRKEIGTKNMFYWLKMNKFPKGYQVMCFNCNCGRSINKGICPHKK